jgi:hypothetical protein
MSTVINKKTFWMNIVLSFFCLLGCLFFFFLNIDYVEARPSEKILNLTLLLAPSLTAIALYKNDKKLLCKIAFALNIVISIMLWLFLLKAIQHRSLDGVIIMLAFSAPFLVNVIQLNKIRKS